jgi:hypothetical protein
MDIGNMYSGGGRAMDLLKKYPGRFQSMHVKDEIKVEGKEGKMTFRISLEGGSASPARQG